MSRLAALLRRCRGGLLAVHRRTPLRVRLVVALVGLAAVALVVAGVAVQSALRGYLVGRVDHQLQGVLTPSFETAIVDRCVLGGDAPPGAAHGFGSFASEYQFSLLTPDGQTVACQAEPSDPLSAGGAAPRLPALTIGATAKRGGNAFTVGSITGSDQWRVVAEPLRDDAGTIVAAVSLSDVDSTMTRLAVTDLVVTLSVLLLLAGLAYLVVGRTLRPLVTVEETAEAIAAGDMSRRMPDDSHPRTEVGRLSRALNGMLAQIERAFRARESSEASARQSEDRMRRFVADASHELRTPLTSIRGFAELYRQGGVATSGDISRAMARIEAEAARMGLLVEDLLTLARLDQQRPLDLGPVDLLRLCADAANDAHAVDPTRTVRVEVLDGDAPPELRGDEARLRQVLANLMSNALCHTPAGTPVALRVGANLAAGQALLEVSDQGPGLSTQDAARVFERFFRADSSRSRGFGGNSRAGSGLGLSIVASLVRAHGGTVAVDSEPGHGATFRVLLPLAGPSSATPTADSAGAQTAGANAPGAETTQAPASSATIAPADHAAGPAGPLAGQEHELRSSTPAG